MENDAGLGAFVQLDPLDFYTKPNSMDMKEERDYEEHVLHKAEVKLFLPRFEYTDVEQLKNQKIQDTNSIPLRDQDRSNGKEERPCPPRAGDVAGGGGGCWGRRGRAGGNARQVSARGGIEC